MYFSAPFASELVSVRAGLGSNNDSTARRVPTEQGLSLLGDGLRTSTTCCMLQNYLSVLCFHISVWFMATHLWTSVLYRDNSCNQPAGVT